MVHVFVTPRPQRQHQFYGIIELLWPSVVTDEPSVSPGAYIKNVPFFEAKIK
jgi:hypothetical protein